MRAPTFFSQHTYSDRLTNQELAAEIETRIATTPWRRAFPFNKVDAIRLRLARGHLAGSVRPRVLFALACGAAWWLLSLTFGALLAELGLTMRRGLYDELFIEGLMGLWFSLIAYWVIKVNGESACFEIGRDLDARGAEREPRT